MPPSRSQENPAAGRIRTRGTSAIRAIHPMKRQRPAVTQRGASIQNSARKSPAMARTQIAPNSPQPQPPQERSAIRQMGV